MSTSLRNPLALAALAAAAMPALSAEVIPRESIEPRRDSIAGWLSRNNRKREVKWAKVRSRLNQRLAPATGPGSINAESELQALVRAERFDEAAAFYEACFRIHYKHGKPKMRWGNAWYAEYKRDKLLAHGVTA